MSRDKASLLDIVNAAKRVLQFAEGFERSALATNEEKQSAILYQVIVIGEATKRLSSEFRIQHSEIPWKDIAPNARYSCPSIWPSESQYPMGCH